MIGLTGQVKNVLNSSRGHSPAFLKREWLTACTSVGLGALTAGLVHLGLLDHAFHAFLSSKYLPNAKLFDEPRVYFPHIIIAALAVGFGIAFFAGRFISRYLRSWWTGVTSGLSPFLFTLTFILCTLTSVAVKSRLIIGVTVGATFSVLSLFLYLWAQVRMSRRITEEELRVPLAIRSRIGTRALESDDPIRTWEQDSLGRIAIVESLTAKLMISKNPVVALFGEFGSGKTSILHLLRGHLENRAIVVFFSTWLPGSKETLISYLLSDIASECQKHYAVPGLRKSAQRLAKALGRNVPLIRSYVESLPAATQKEEIENLNAALNRLPQRVIVLLDELDRMEQEELSTLLKIIRGILILQNVSFVCAGERRTMVELIKGVFNDSNNTYFEKFFPASVPIPKMPAAVLQKIGTQRLTDVFIRRDWLQSEVEVDGFRKQLEAIWNERIAPLCRSFRAVGSLANDVDAAAVRLKHEVHPIDLILIELLRRFKPEIYEIIGRNPIALTGGKSVLRGGTFLLEKDRKNIEKQLLEDIKDAIPDDRQRLQVNGIIGELFPEFRKLEGQAATPRPITQQSNDKTALSVSQPRIFSAYFDYELPDDIFSYVELNGLLHQMEAAPSDLEGIFMKTLDSMEKGSLRRDDFLIQVADASRTVTMETAKALVRAAMRAAHKYTYDMLAAFGEAGHVLRIVIRVAQRLPVSERSLFLSQCIVDATDDTMALNILTRLTGPHDDFNLEVSLAELHPAFIARMRKRYGREVDLLNVDLTSADPWAFNYWGHQQQDKEITNDPEDRAIQRDFWLRHIGNSRLRLAQDFRAFFMPAAVSYSEDPVPFVENKIPIADLRRLYDQLTHGELSDVDRQSLKTLQRLLNGEFKNGAGIGPYHYPDENAASAAQ